MCFFFARNVFFPCFMCCVCQLCSSKRFARKLKLLQLISELCWVLTLNMETKHKQCDDCTMYMLQRFVCIMHLTLSEEMSEWTKEKEYDRIDKGQFLSKLFRQTINSMERERKKCDAKSLFWQSLAKTQTEPSPLCNQLIVTILERSKYGFHFQWERLWLKKSTSHT